MPTTQTTMTDEQRRAIFARLHGGGAAAAARNPYTPEPVSGWEVFKGGLSGFAEGAADGIANIVNSASFGLSDLVGLTHTYEQTGWASDFSKIAADIGVLAASLAYAGAGKAGEKGTSLLGKKALAKAEARREAAKQALTKSEGAARQAAHDVLLARDKAADAWRVVREVGSAEGQGWTMTRASGATSEAVKYAVEMDTRAVAAQMKYERAVEAMGRTWKEVAEATQEARKLASGLAEASNLARGAAGFGGLVEGMRLDEDWGNMRQRQQAEAEARAEAEYKRHAAEILAGVY